jgi:AraC-like DNA-binding protein
VSSPSPASSAPRPRDELGVHVPSKPCTMAKLESLRRGGASIRRIASVLGLSPTTVARLVRDQALDSFVIVNSVMVFLSYIQALRILVARLPFDSNGGFTRPRVVKQRDIDLSAGLTKDMTIFANTLSPLPKH